MLQTERDVELEKEVMAELQHHFPRDCRNIKVTAHYGVVILTGTAKNNVLKWDMCGVVCAVAGVLDVFNYLKIRRPNRNTELHRETQPGCEPVNRMIRPEI
ncbi:MAG: BON domain-containing protein [Blastocatellia bacterium]|nr:BON domain-containing protein [Blastocatellia bacterium]